MNGPGRHPARAAALLLVLAWVKAAPAADTGWRTGAFVAAGGSWGGTFSTANLAASDDARAVNVGGTTAAQAGALATFGLTVPGAAVVSGIEAEIEGSDGTAAQTVNFSVQLSWNNGIAWTNAQTGSFTGTTDVTTVRWPGSLWSRAWTPAELADVSFRLRIFRTGGTGDLRLDRIRVRVSYYALPWPGGAMQVRTGSYYGNGANGRAITGLGFQPDVVLVIQDATCNLIGGLTYTCGRDSVIRTTTMGPGNISGAGYGTNNPPVIDRVQSLDPDGFTVGEPPDHNLPNDNPAMPFHCANHTGLRYFWTAFKAGAGELELGTYVGDGLASRDITALTFQPDYVLITSTEGERILHRTSGMPADTSFDIEGGAYCPTCGFNPAIRTELANGFRLGPFANANLETFHYVAWKAVAGRMAVGSYAGNGGDNRSFAGLGFRPEVVTVQRGTLPPNQSTTIKTGAMGATNDLSFPHINYGGPWNPTNAIQALEADGFQVGTANSVNFGGDPYYWAAFGPGSGGACCGLSTSTSGLAVTVSADNFQMRFSPNTGGGIDTFYDLDEDPSRTYDLAGGTGTGRSLHGDGLQIGATIFNVAQNDQGVKVDLLEATPTRVRVRSEAFYQQEPGTALLAGLKAFGDYSVYGSGRTALRWTERATSAVLYSTHDLDLNVHRQGLAPLNAWVPFSQTDGTFNNPGTDDFLLVQSNVAGLRTDFLHVLYRDWTIANGYLGTADTTQWFTDAGNERGNPFWEEGTGATILAGAGPYSLTGEAWNFLTYFKPTSFVNHADAAVTSRSADYRVPSALAVLVGSPWQLASEKTGPGDDYNEDEATYVATLDPANGLTVRIDGTAANPRYKPFFKIRQWRSLGGPPSVTFQGAPLRAGVDYLADVKPVSRANFTDRVDWHSTLENAAAVAAPDIGPAGSSTGATYVAARYGNGLLIDQNTDVVSYSASVLDAGLGAVDFWYRPAYACQPAPGTCDGVRHVFWSGQADADHFITFEKTAADTLLFQIQNGPGAPNLSTRTVSLPDFSWRANDWVHLRVAWNSAEPLPANRLRIFVNNVEVTAVSSGAYTGSGLATGLAYIGTLYGLSDHAAGIIDEFTMGQATQRLAYGGLVTHADEYLAHPTRNRTLSFGGVDALGIGPYLYLGADSQFRGLNVGLTTPGAGVAAGDIDWEYWNGTAWANLESVGGFADLTNSFTRTGNVYWQDPPSWSPYSVDGGPDLYFVRAHLKNGSTYSTPPVDGIIKTDILLFQLCRDIIAAAQELVFAAPIPTAVELLSFSAAGGDSRVELSWTTASELDNLGFHLYRSLSSEGPYERITSSVIAGLGSSATGRSYAYTDAGRANGVTYHYQLQDIETTGTTKLHGPVSATPQAGSSGGEGGDGGAGSGEGEEGGEAGDEPGGIRYGDPAPPALRILERGPSHVVLELLTPGFSAEPQGDGSVLLHVEGFEADAPPGSLAVPVRETLVEARAGRRVFLTSVVPSDVLSFESLRLSGAPLRELVVTAQGVVRPGSSPRSLRSSERRPGLMPRTWAQLLGSVFQGETKKARLLLAPLRHDPASLRTVLARRLVVRLDFAGPEAGERSLGGSRGLRPPLPSLRRGGVLAELQVKNPGLYQVRFEDVLGPGHRGVSARNLRLSRLGEAVPYHLEPDRALFGPGSRIFFPSEGESLNPLGEVVYELRLGQAAARMGIVSGAASGPAVTEYLHTLKMEENRFYQSALLPAPDLWLWDLLVSPVTKAYAFEVDHLSSSATSSSLRVVLQGASDFEALDHHVRVFLNGIPVGEATWDGKVERVVEAEVGAGVLQEGANSLVLENVGDAGAAYSMVFLNRFEVVYPRLPVSSAGVLRGGFEQSGRTEVTGLTGPGFVVDETSRAWLKDALGGPSGLAFRAEASHSYLAVSEGSLLAPEIRRPSSPRLASRSNRAEWVLLSPRELLPAAQPLLELRRSQGLLAKTIALEDVYSEFGFGERSARAIREFLSVAFHAWKTPPRYVLLLGDATYDPKDYLRTGVPDLAPSEIVKTSFLWTVSDPTLAAVNGEDLLPDLAIGRLSAGTYEQARRLVDKLVAFEQAGRNFEGRAVLVADNADLAGHFEADQDEIASGVLAGREVDKLYLRDLGPGLRPSLKAALDAGPAILSYVGHGSTAVWASENVWNNQDLASLDAQAQQPLLLTWNCLNGFFQFPPLDSLAEAFVKAEGKGALAAFAPSGLSLNDAAQAYHKALLGEIVSGRHQRLGDAVLAAQTAYAEGGSFPELLSIYHLFGDPATSLR